MENEVTPKPSEAEPTMENVTTVPAHPESLGENEVTTSPVQPEPEVEVKPKLWTKKNMFLLLSVSYSNFMLGTCYSLPAPFFPREAEHKGATPTIYGLVFGAFQFVAFIMSPLTGKLMPYLVPRFVLVAGMFVAGSCSVLFGLLEFSPPGAPYITLSFLVRIVEAMGTTAYITTCYGILPVLFPKNVATVLSTMETLFGFGLIAGPTIGGALYQVGGYYLPFAVMGGLLMIGTLFTSLSFSSKDESPPEKTGSYLKLLASRGMIIDCTVFTVGAICIGYNDATLEPHLRQFNLKPAVLGSVFIILGGIYAFVSPVYGYFMDKGAKPHLFCLLGSLLCFAAFLIVGPVPFLPFQTSFPVIIVALVLQGFGIGAQVLGAFVHGIKDITDRGFPDSVSSYALFSGLMVSFSSLGSFSGPSIGGALLEHVGYEKGTIVVAGFEGLLFILLVTHLILERFERRTVPPTTSEPVDPVINNEESERTPLLRSADSATA